MNAVTIAVTKIALAAAAMAAPPYPEGRVTIKVVNDNSEPVEAADVAVGFAIMSKTHFGNEEIEIRGSTNGEGKFTASARADSNLGFTVRKAGYYDSTGKYDFKATVADKWQPWDPTVIVTLKKVGAPTAMYAKKVDLALPAFDVPVGFDLLIGDWVSPYGQGTVLDLVCTAHLQQRNKRDYDYELVVSFSNPRDGIQSFDVPPFYGSQMKSPRSAPLEGYLPQWKQLRKRSPGTAEVSNSSESRNYLFRVRTVVDQKGDVVSALYGKIYGDFLRFTYYINPTSNDRNIEFDSKKNLFPILKDSERPTAP
jgi:hypothetical protein